MRASVNARHRAWLRRHTTNDAKAASWRPAKKNRMGTLSHIMKLDCQLIVGLGGNGLADLKPDGSDLWSAATWRRWPGALGVQDQGSKGVSANQALVYKPEIALNLLTLYDFSHGACRDLDLQYSEQGYMVLVVLSLVVVNLRSGPEQEPGMRHEQLVDAGKYFFQGFSRAELRLVPCAPSWHPERDSQRGRSAPM